MDKMYDVGKHIYLIIYITAGSSITTYFILKKNLASDSFCDWSMSKTQHCCCTFFLKRSPCECETEPTFSSIKPFHWAHKWLCDMYGKCKWTSKRIPLRQPQEQFDPKTRNVYSYLFLCSRRQTISDLNWLYRNLLFVTQTYMLPWKSWAASYWW